MARTQRQARFIAETLLTSASDRRRSLEGMRTAGLIEGSVCYVTDKDRDYILRPNSDAPVDGDEVIAATDGGRWESTGGEGEGGDPVIVRNLADLPEPVGGVITLADNTRYEIVGEVDVGANYIQAGQDNLIVGRAGVLLQSSSPGSGNPLIRLPDTGRLTLERITLQATSYVIRTLGSADLVMRDCVLEDRPGSSGATGISASSPVSGGDWTCTDCWFGASLGRGFRFTSGTIGSITFKSCTFSCQIAMQVGAGCVMDEWYVEGCVFDTQGQPATCITADGAFTVNKAQATNNDFSRVRLPYGTAFNDTVAVYFSPIEVRSPQELGAYESTTIRRLALGVKYLIMADVEGYGVNGAENTSMYGRGGKLVDCTLFCQHSVAPFRLQDLTIESPDRNGAVFIGGAGALKPMVIENCDITAKYRPVQGSGSGTLHIHNTRLVTALAGSAGLSLDDYTAFWREVQIEGCTFQGAGGGIDLEGRVITASIAGCIFDTVAGQVGLADNGPVTVAGRINGNIFTGAGTPTSGVTAPNGWAARGNIGVADF
jgi:hypothetical protein